ncbi:MAG: cupin domain-containing protein [Streptosporangiaceae bacterium]
MTESQVAGESSPAVAIPLRHLAADQAQLPPAEAKPTSLTGQFEASLTAWASDIVDAGIWECEPGEFTADRSTSTEICQILSGAATVTGEDGTATEIGPGSLLVLPRGWRGRWVIREHLRKTYVVISDAD